MTRARIIFYSVFGVYHLLAFLFTAFMDRFLLDLLGYVGWFKYITLLGVLLIIADFVWLLMDNRRHLKAEEAYRLENNTLKAKVYDFQEGAKAKPKDDLSKANKPG